MQGRALVLLVLAASLLAAPLALPAAVRDKPPRLKPTAKSAVPAPADTPADALSLDDALANLRSPDWILQAEAIAILARSKAPEAAGALKAVVAGQWHPWIRGRALVALARMLGQGVVPDALAVAGDPLPELREAAMESLGLTGAQAALPAIEARLADPVASVRCKAVVALARIRKEKVWDKVAPLLASGDPAIIRQTVPAIVYVDTPEARKQLVPLLEYPDAGVRLAAIRALAVVRDPAAIVPLFRHTVADSTSVENKAAAERALMAYDPRDLARPLLEAMRGTSGLVGPGLKILKARPSAEARAGVAALLAQNRDYSSALMTQALEVLAGDSPTDYLETFVRSLTDPQAPVRRKAVEILGQCPSANPFIFFKPLLADKDTEVRTAVLRTLRECAEAAPPGGIIDYLGPALGDLSSDAFSVAADLAAAWLTEAEVPKALAALDPVLAGGDERRRQQAAAIFDRFASEDVNRRIASAQGFITQWLVLGPFPHDADLHGYSAVYPPEVALDPGKACDAWPFGYGAAFKAVAAAGNGTKRPSILLRPPENEGHGGRLTATYTLDLPEAGDVKLAMFLSIPDDAPEGGGLTIEVAVGGRKVFEQKVPARSPWAPAEVNLAEFAGRRVTLDLAVDPGAGAPGDWLLVGDPQIQAGGKVAADLVKLAPQAPARITMAENVSPRLAWDVGRVSRPDGVLDLAQAVTAEEYHVAYAVADIESSVDQKAGLVIGHDDGAKAWLSGVKVAEHPTSATTQATVDLKKGRNRLLVKVCNEWDRWMLSVRVTDTAGKRLSAVAFSLPK